MSSRPGEYSWRVDASQRKRRHSIARTLSPGRDKTPMDEVPRQVDVVLMGGGPAGSATALLLGKAGLSTLILNPAPKYSRLGETLPAAAAPLLRHLGVWNSFCEQDPSRLGGLASAWGGSNLECRDLFST